MEEKYMVCDVLENAKSNITESTKAIYETENSGLRQSLRQIRDDCESFQYELFKIARTKGYYSSSEEANQKEIDKIKNEIE